MTQSDTVTEDTCHTGVVTMVTKTCGHQCNEDMTVVEMAHTDNYNHNNTLPR